MPLGFSSLSHGEIAFGFFNIETDLLLLDRYFIFASDFCEHIAAIAAGAPGERIEKEWEVYALQEGEIGSVIGAIHGFDLRGFIGDVYRVYPFPVERDAFRQNAEGFANRARVEEIIRRYQNTSKIGVVVDETGATIEIGDYLFSREVFHNLLMYVWEGGYPRWKPGTRPAHVFAMKQKILAALHPLFSGMPEFI